jgi:hypothetical protein
MRIVWRVIGAAAIIAVFYGLIMFAFYCGHKISDLEFYTRWCEPIEGFSYSAEAHHFLLYCFYSFGILSPVAFFVLVAGYAVENIILK